MNLNDLNYEELIIIKQSLVCMEKYGYDPRGPNYEKDLKALKKVVAKVDSAITEIEFFDDET